MEKIKKGDMVELIASEGCTLHRIGSDERSEIRRLKTSHPEDWEEIAVDAIPKYTTAEYEAKVEELIRERYSVSAELAILRQRDTKADEFADYDAYAEECKSRAKVELGECPAEKEGPYESVLK